jgi:hypothetical protein
MALDEDEQVDKRRNGEKKAERQDHELCSQKATGHHDARGALHRLDQVNQSEGRVVV